MTTTIPSTSAASNLNKSLPPTQETSSRLWSIDAYRGFVMFLMMAEILHLSSLAEKFPDSSLCQWLRFHTTHVEWIGCSLHDLIQPSFSFLVGVSLAFSLLKRFSHQQNTTGILLHAAWRSLLLIGLGIFLRSLHREQTYFTFEDTLTQIGLGYFPLVLIGLARPYVAWIATVLILIGYWALFALYPLPSEDFDMKTVGVPADWPHLLEGFEEHWDKNTNPAWAFDRWWLNLFPREQPFEFNRGGYATLSFVPTLATMLLGLIAGRWLTNRSTIPSRMLGQLLAAALICGALGWLLGSLHLCPVVKRIWTPSWVLWSGGWCFLLLAVFHLLLDHLKWTRAFFPLVVIGANSIASYVMAETIAPWISENLTKHFGTKPFEILGDPFRPILLGGTTLVCMWLILHWMYRNKVFVKI